MVLWLDSDQQIQQTGPGFWPRSGTSADPGLPSISKVAGNGLAVFRLGTCKQEWRYWNATEHRSSNLSGAASREGGGTALSRHNGGKVTAVPQGLAHNRWQCEDEQPCNHGDESGLRIPIPKCTTAVPFHHDFVIANCVDSLKLHLHRAFVRHWFGIGGDVRRAPKNSQKSISYCSFSATISIL